jgi:hypothetical protein
MFKMLRILRIFAIIIANIKRGIRLVIARTTITRIARKR